MDVQNSISLVDGNRTYRSIGRCQICGNGPQPVVIVRSGPAGCRSCYIDLVTFFDDCAKRFHMNRQGVPAMPAPPVQQVCVTPSGGHARIGTARLVREVNVDTVEVHELFLFPDALGVSRVDLLVETWKGAWTAVDVGGVNHVRKAEPAELLEKIRFGIVLPDDAPGDVFEIECRRLAV